MDVIRFQPGDTLTEILETPATSEQVHMKVSHWISFSMIGASLGGDRGTGKGLDPWVSMDLAMEQ